LARQTLSIHSPAGYTLRDATADDAPALVALLHAAFAEHAGKLDPPSGVHAETAASLAARFGNGGAIVALHTASGTPAGCAFVEWRDGYAYIGRVGTLPAHRRAGLGGAMLDALEARARAKGYAHARLATRVHWAALRRFYEARGYRAVLFGAHAGKPWPTWVQLDKDLVARHDGAEGFAAARLDHLQLAIPRGKEDEARAFWVGVLGFDEIPKDASATSPGGAWFQGGQAQVHLGVEDDFRPARKAHPALRVRGLEALRARLTAAGRPIEPLAPLAGCARFHTSDPFGNRVEFIAETT